MTEIEAAADRYLRGGTSTGVWYRPEQVPDIIQSVRKTAFQAGARWGLEKAEAIAHRHEASWLDFDDPMHAGDIAREIRALKSMPEGDSTP